MVDAGRLRRQRGRYFDRSESRIETRLHMEFLPKEPTSKGSPDIFVGDVWVDLLASGSPPSRIRVGVVHFAPGARNAWHAHAVGQTLHVIEGVGRVQARGGGVLGVKAGGTNLTPPCAGDLDRAP